MDNVTLLTWSEPSIVLALHRPSDIPAQSLICGPALRRTRRSVLSGRGRVWVFSQTVMHGGCPRDFACPLGAKSKFHIAMHPSPLGPYVRGGRRGDTVRRAGTSRLPRPASSLSIHAQSLPTPIPNIFPWPASTPPPDRALSSRVSRGGGARRQPRWRPATEGSRSRPAASSSPPSPNRSKAAVAMVGCTKCVIGGVRGD
jgi:hypothetical protein